MAWCLSGPSHGPLLGGNPRSIVVLLHGYGASGDDLIGLAYSWASSLPQTLFVSPHAPFPCESNSFGRQWTSLKDLDPKRLWAEIGMVTPLLDIFLNDLLKKYHLSWSNLALVGFSQGAALSLIAGLYHFPVAGIISYSSLFIPHPQKIPPQKTPVLLVHGSHDEVLPIKFHKEAKKEFSHLQIPFDSMVCENLGHGINPIGLEKGAQFLRKNLKEVHSFQQEIQTVR